MQYNIYTILYKIICKSKSKIDSVNYKMSHAECVLLSNTER